jgi:hypothetical protein
VRWKDELRRATDEELGDTISRNTEFYVIEVSFQSAESLVDTTDLQEIPTAFRISNRDVQRIGAFVRDALRNHPEWQRLLRDIREGR